MVNTFARLSLIFCLTSLSHCAVRNDNETFLQAQQAYEHHDLQKALDLYKSIEPKGDAVWFNMGVCAFEQGDKAYALYYWNQAKKSASPKTYKQVKEALTHVQDEGNLRRNAVGNFLEFNSTYLSIGGWQLVVLFELFIFLLLWFFARRMRRFLLIGVALIIVYSSILLWFAHKRAVDIPAIVKAEHASMYIAPNNKLASIGTLKRGTAVIILKKEDSWYKVGYLNKNGWMNADDFIGS
jgi:hypothetical protein